MIDRWKYAIVACIGRVMASVKLNSTCRLNGDQRPARAKWRRWFSPAFIAIGNLYLKWIGAHSRILKRRDWYTWETQVYLALHGIELTTNLQGYLLVPEWPGCPLASILESQSTGEAEKILAIGLAARSLSRLHQVVVRWPDGFERPLSHGDATVENVIVDDIHSNASLFDFDIIHQPDLSTAHRHADDLRALTFSAAQHLDRAMFPTTVRAIVENYSRESGYPQVLESLVEQVLSGRKRPNSFHLAQAQIGYDDSRLLEEAMFEELNRRVATMKCEATAKESGNERRE